MLYRFTKLTAVLITMSISFSLAAEAQSTKVYHMARDKNIERGMKAISDQNFEKASHNLWRAANSNQTKTRQVTIYNNICAVEFVLERYESALNACDKALKLDRINWRVLLNRGNIYRETGYFDKARLDYRAVSKLRPGEPMLPEAQRSLAIKEQKLLATKVAVVTSH
ncbi:hypothetical protein [Kordiimonas sp. SCSIO 12610]|uniref:hypothetical protein n=1 Tax=Kordiimonas sp. SCSIO 12610 TaxID=2829597 RepID=UPI00210CED22|nr:hypothetical protein [Kordiimonas sp. SCSIO 12610]UTW56731.1 hypothetical protein KFF44_07540 [Kordiimonas sp. SCSIO 12610]